MPKPLISIEDLEYSRFGKGEELNAVRADVSSKFGATKHGHSGEQKIPVPGEILG